MRQLKITKQITNRDSPSLDKYLTDIAKKEMVTAEEETLLAIKIKEGDMIALERLVNANLRFVVSVAKQYQNQGLALSDLINEGNIGLIKAAKRFDETKGFKFISYAVWWIRQAIMQAIAEQARVVRLPLNKIGSIIKVNRATSRLEQEFEREPTVFELANELDAKVEDVRMSIANRGKHISMDAPVSEGDDERTMYDMIGSETSIKPDEGLMRESLIMEIERSLKTLQPREANIVKFFYGLGNSKALTLDEIGQHFELTRERVRQIKEKAIRRLKHNSRSRVLKAYLG